METINSSPDIIRVNSKKCVNCHQCISECPVKFCNDASNLEEGIKINSNLCIGCGHCIDKCPHNAREIIDDTDTFFNDLKNGEKIATLVAPAVYVNFPSKLNKLLGWFKSMNVQKNFDVSFGAEITTFQYYLELSSSSKEVPIISQPCPCVVNFIETYKPNLIKHLAPIGSPVINLAKWINYNYPDYKLAFISPCIAKKREFDDVNSNQLISYNVTVNNLKKYLDVNNINLDLFNSVNFEGPIEAEKGVLYSQPGGLIENIKKYNLSLNLNQVRQVEGVELYTEFFDELEKELKNNTCDLLLVDVLNCKNGCNLGTGIPKDTLTVNKALSIQNRRLEETIDSNYSNENDYEKLQKIIEYISFLDFTRKYNDKSEVFKNLEEPNEEMLDIIHQQMGKVSKSDIKNCGSCGYNSCNAMAKAVLNDLYRPQQCHHFLESYYQNNSGDGDFRYLPLRRLTRHRQHIIESLAKEKLYYFINLFVKFGWLYQKKDTKVDISNIIENLFKNQLTLDEISNKSFAFLVDFIIDSGSEFINNEITNSDILKDTIRKSYKLNSKIDNILYETIKACLENITFFDVQKKSIEEKIKKESESFINQLSKLTSVQGMDLIIASGIISEIAGISRFETLESLIEESGINNTNKNHNRYLNYYILFATEKLKDTNPIFIELYKNISKEHKGKSNNEILNIVAIETIDLIFSQLKNND
jgi:iron only hydrogenase large subunit-like protein/peroxiredoxin family protein